MLQHLEPLDEDVICKLLCCSQAMAGVVHASCRGADRPAALVASCSASQKLPGSTNWALGEHAMLHVMASASCLCGCCRGTQQLHSVHQATPPPRRVTTWQRHPPTRLLCTRGQDVTSITIPPTYSTNTLTNPSATLVRAHTDKHRLQDASRHTPSKRQPLQHHPAMLLRKKPSSQVPCGSQPQTHWTAHACMQAQLCDSGCLRHQTRTEAHTAKERSWPHAQAAHGRHHAQPLARPPGSAHALTRQPRLCDTQPIL